MTMSLVQTVTVGPAGAASIEFTGIPQTGQDLMVVFSGRVASAVAEQAVRVRLNGDTAANYDYLFLLGYDGTTFNNITAANTNANILKSPGASSTTSVFSNDAIYFANYKSATAKSFSADSTHENNSATGYGLQIAAAKWSGTAAITAVQLYVSGDTFVQYSSATLYTISTTGATGATVA